jgi:hypothetical protein
MANAAAGGQGQAYGSANAQEHRLKAKGKGVEQEGRQGKSAEKVDHLGIEG